VSIALNGLVSHLDIAAGTADGTAPLTPRLSDDFPSVLSLVSGERTDLGYQAIEVSKEPGTCFAYSGGGFLVLQHLIEAMEGAAVEGVCRPFLDITGLSDFSFIPHDLPRALGRYALGFSDTGDVVAAPTGRLAFPPFAAGALGTPRSLANFWAELIAAYTDTARLTPIAHATAVAVLRDNVRDLGSVDFMGARMGLGVFVMDAGPNKVAVHQAANEGFRGVYIACFEGPDVGKVMVVLSNGDNYAALLNAEVSRLLLRRWQWKGVNGAVLEEDAEFIFRDIPQEQIVNQAYKALVFSAFEPSPA
ncbi:unnamed protein product, partial [Symbiodinium pilosum]